MKRLKQYLSLLFLSFFMFTSAHAQEIVTYRNGIDKHYPPFAYINEKGEPDGFEVKALNWVANEMGFKVEHIPMDWDKVISNLLANRIDMICSGLSMTPERGFRILFTPPHISFPRVIATRNESNITINDVFTSPTKIGTQRGTNEQNHLDQEKIRNSYAHSIHYYDTGASAIRGLVAKEVDAVALGSQVVKDAIAKGDNIKIIGEFYEPAQFAIGLRKTDNGPDLYNILNEGYSRLRKDPYWEELQKAYLSGTF